MGLNILTFIIVACILISYKALQDESLKSKWTFFPYAVKHHNEGWRIFSHMWIHADFNHLLFNMVSLYFLGSNLQLELGAKYGFALGQVHFGVLYLLGGLMATLIPFYRNQDNTGYRSLGASGAVSAIVFATILWSPDMRLGLIFLPGISFKAWMFGIVYLAYEFWMDRRGNSGIAHDAHIGGAVLGIIYILVLYPDKGKMFFYHLMN